MSTVVGILIAIAFITTWKFWDGLHTWDETEFRCSNAVIKWLEPSSSTHSTAADLSSQIRGHL